LPESKKLLIEISSHLAVFVHFANRKTLPFIPFDGTFEVDRCPLYRTLGGQFVGLCKVIEGHGKLTQSQDHAPDL
jgi:hypothetical protein